MSPLIGLHTVLGLLVAWVFRLNRFVSIVGIYVTNPWTIVPIYSFGIWIGAKLLAMNHIIPDIDWAHLSIKEFLFTFRPLLLPFVLGTTVLGSASTVLSYLLIYRLIKRNRG